MREDSFLFFCSFSFPGGRRPLPRDRAVLWRVLSLSLFVETRERETFPFVNLFLCFCVVIERAVLNRFITLSLSRSSSGPVVSEIFFGDRSRKKNQRLTALLERTKSQSIHFLKQLADDNFQTISLSLEIKKHSLAPRQTFKRRGSLRRRRGLEAQRAHAGRNVLR